jgi:hypothetical protein
MSEQPLEPTDPKSETEQPPEPTDPKSELKKLGTGRPVNDVLLWEQMEEDRMDKGIRTLTKVADEKEAKRRAQQGEPPQE